MSVITTTGGFIIGFLLACYFIGEDNKDFYDFCKTINKWINKKSNNKKDKNK